MKNQERVDENLKDWKKNFSEAKGERGIYENQYEDNEWFRRRMKRDTGRTENQGRVHTLTFIYIFSIKNMYFREGGGNLQHIIGC